MCLPNNQMQHYVERDGPAIRIVMIHDGKITNNCSVSLSEGVACQYLML